MKAWPALISGVLFGLGLTLSGMSGPAKVEGFLNITGDWVPDLIFVMGGAVVVSVLLTPLVLKRAAPLMGGSFSLPLTATLDKRLIASAILFGIGWGLSGHRLGLVRLLPGAVRRQAALRLQEHVRFLDRDATGYVTGGSHQSLATS